MTRPIVVVEPTKVPTVPGYTVETAVNLVRSRDGCLFVDMLQASGPEESLGYTPGGHLMVLDEHGRHIEDNSGVLLTVEMLRAVLETVEEIAAGNSDVADRDGKRS